MIIPGPCPCLRGDGVKLPRFDRPEDIPGQVQVQWRRAPLARPLAAVAAIMWPPLIITLLIWPPANWLPGIDTDWRLVLLVIGIAAVPLGLWFMSRGHARSGRPATRLGVVWRFMLWGGLLAALLQVVMALIMVILGWFQSGSAMQGLGATETTLLIYGVAGLPVATLVGVSYALWSGLCVAFIAFQKSPQTVNDRLGVLSGR